MHARATRNSAYRQRALPGTTRQLLVHWTVVLHFNRPVHTRSPHPSTATGNATVLLLLHATLSTASDTATHPRHGLRVQGFSHHQPCCRPRRRRSRRRPRSATCRSGWSARSPASCSAAAPSTTRCGALTALQRLSSGSPAALKRLSNGSPMALQWLCNGFLIDLRRAGARPGRVGWRGSWRGRFAAGLGARPRALRRPRAAQVRTTDVPATLCPTPGRICNIQFYTGVVYLFLLESSS